MARQTKTEARAWWADYLEKLRPKALAVLDDPDVRRAWNAYLDYQRDHYLPTPRLMITWLTNSMSLAKDFLVIATERNELDQAMACINCLCVHEPIDKVRAAQRALSRLRYLKTTDTNSMFNG
jgi:hypothetical protein